MSATYAIAFIRSHRQRKYLLLYSYFPIGAKFYLDCATMAVDNWTINLECDGASEVQKHMQMEMDRDEICFFNLIELMKDYRYTSVDYLTSEIPNTPLLLQFITPPSVHLLSRCCFFLMLLFIWCMCYCSSTDYKFLNGFVIHNAGPLVYIKFKILI